MHHASGVDNIIAALEHSDRVCQIQPKHLTTSSELEYITDSAAILMHKPFPELTDLRLGGFVYVESILPDSFLGGTAPRLRSISGITKITFVFHSPRLS
jgi:hypothetical protein